MKREGSKPFLWVKRQGKYESRSWIEIAEQSVLIARVLAKLGLEAGDRVVLVSENRPE